MIKTIVAYSLVNVRIIEHRPGDSTLRPWVQEIADGVALLPRGKRSVWDCVEVAETLKSGMDIMRFTRRVVEFEFQHAGDGYEGVISAMSDSANAYGHDWVFEDYRKPLYVLAKKTRGYWWDSDRKRRGYILNTLWKSEIETDTQDEEHWDQRNTLLGTCSITDIARLLEAQVKAAQNAREGA